MFVNVREMANCLCMFVWCIKLKEKPKAITTNKFLNKDYVEFKGGGRGNNRIF